jgi:hypothetical protein
MVGQCASPLHPATQGTREASETICQRVILLTSLPVFPFGHGRHILRSTKRGYMRVVVVFRTKWSHDRARHHGTTLHHTSFPRCRLHGFQEPFICRVIELPLHIFAILRAE